MSNTKLNTAQNFVLVLAIVIGFLYGLAFGYMLGKREAVITNQSTKKY